MIHKQVALVIVREENKVDVRRAFTPPKNGYSLGRCCICKYKLKYCGKKLTSAVIIRTRLQAQLSERERAKKSWETYYHVI